MEEYEIVSSLTDTELIETFKKCLWYRRSEYHKWRCAMTDFPLRGVENCGLLLEETVCERLETVAGLFGEGIKDQEYQKKLQHLKRERSFLIKWLRARTGCSVKQCKDAADYSHCDAKVAVAYLRAKNLPVCTPTLSFDERVKSFVEGT